MFCLHEFLKFTIRKKKIKNPKLQKMILYFINFLISNLHLSYICMPIYMYTQIWRFLQTHVNILSCVAPYIWERKQSYVFTLLMFLYYRSLITSKHKFLSLLLSNFFFFSVLPYLRKTLFSFLSQSFSLDICKTSSLFHSMTL